MQSWLARTQPYVDHQRLRDLSRYAAKAPPHVFPGGTWRKCTRNRSSTGQGVLAGVFRIVIQ